jgi:hypothetical protein
VPDDEPAAGPSGAVPLAAFPPGTAGDLWLAMTDRDLVVVEERTALGHQLAILGHELWHVQGRARRTARRGSRGRGRQSAPHGTDRDEEALRATVRTVAARSGFDLADEREAEAFGLLPASKCRTWPAGSSPRGPVRRDHLAGRIEASLGYLG